MKIKNKILFTIIIIILKINGFSQSNTLYHDIFYYSHEQNMWGPDSAYGIDVNHTFFDLEIDESYGFTEITEIFGQQFGIGFETGIYSLLSSTWEAYGFYSGKFDLDYPIQVILEFPEHNSFDYGGPATIHTSYIVTNGWALDTEFPPVGVVTLDFEYEFDPYMDIVVCVFSCDTMHIIPSSIHVPHTLDTLFHINGYTEYTVYPCYVDDEFTFCHDYELPIDVDFTDLVNFDFVIQVDLPYVETEAYVEEETNCLIASGSDPYMNTQLDILGFLYVMAGYLPEPEGPAIQEAIGFLNGEISYPVETPIGEISFDIDYSLMDIYLHIANTLIQDIYFCPTIWATFDFPVALPYVITDPSNNNIEVESGYSDTIKIAVGNDLTITYPCHGTESYVDSMYVGVSYNIQPTIRNHTWDSIAFSIAIEALSAEIIITTPWKSTFSEIEMPEFILPEQIISENKQTVGSSSIQYVNYYESTDEQKDLGPWTVGPLFEWTVSLGHVSATWFDETWELMHFEEDLEFPGTYIKPYDKSEINALLYIDGGIYCYGDSYDFIYAEAQNGQAPYTYEWSTGHITHNTMHDTDSIWAEPGFYMVTITDSYGCESYDSITVAVNEPIIYSFNITDIYCHGFNQGAVETNVNGGTPPYFFNWSNGSNLQNPVNLSAGWHTVTITDWKGCNIVDSVFIDQPETPLTIDTTLTHIPCFGMEYGSIEVQLSGAAPPYSIEWSSGQTYQNLTNIPAGTYTISVTDANDCLWTETINILEPDTLIATIEHTNIPCAGDNSGSISVHVTGGTPDYTYFWFHNPQENSSELTDLNPGLYMVSVIDKNNCSDTATVIISQPDRLVLDFFIKDASCKGTNDGYIIAYPDGGTPDYTIVWSTGHYNDSIGGLPAGNYTVTLTDNNNCSVVHEATVSEPEQHLSSEFYDIINPSCFGYNDASANVIPEGGASPYNVVWEDGVEQEGFTGHGMSANIFYNITVTDINNCMYFDSIKFTQPLVMETSVTTTDVICGVSSGSGQVQHTVGGTPPYSYLWSSGEQGNSAYNLQTGEIFVTVTDSNNCTEIIGLTVGFSGKINGYAEIIRENLCYKDSIAVAVASLPDGIEPKTFIWSDQQTGDTAYNLYANTYTIYAYDKYNCGDTISLSVTHPDSIRPNFEIIRPSCSGEFDGSIAAYPTGGTKDYSYYWNDGSTQHIINEIREGNYYLTITDNNSCIFEYQIELKESKYCVFVYNTFTPNGDGVNDTWIIENIEHFKYSKVWVYNRVGNLVFYENNYQNDWAGTYNDKELPEGTYYYIIDLGTAGAPIKGHVTIIR